MPDIDPAALGRSDSNVAGTATPPLAAKALPSTSAQKPGKPMSTPRLDIEPLYTALKSAIGDHWVTYKDAISRFVLGYLSQEELCRLTERFIAVDPQREHLHNQLICGLYANTLRDAPEQVVAGWVSANDKPTAVAKPVSGDAAEQRVKVEVMQLPPRFRHRIKAIQDEPWSPLSHSLAIHAQARRIVPISSPSLAGANASATGGLNKDLEVRKRYALPLASESHDLPPVSSLTDRLLPICYEEGLLSGPASPGPCVNLLSIGLETFVKEVVISILGRSRTNAPVSGSDFLTTSSGASTTAVSVTSTVGLGSTGPGAAVRTAGYKRKLDAEEAAFALGELKRSETGLLPCEVAASHGLGLQGDLRLAWDMQEPWLVSLMPWLGEKTVLGNYAHATFDLEAADEDMMVLATMNPDAAGKKANGISSTVNGIGPNHHIDSMAIDEPSWGWRGGGATERAGLGSLLDDCLAIAY